MKYFPLVWSMLWRSRARTGLTFASIVVAFFLFGLLQAILLLFGGAHGLGMANNLIVTARQGFGLPLPIAHRSRIEALAGVTAVTPIAPFPAWYQDHNNPLNAVAAGAGFFSGDPRILIAPDQARAFREIRTGAAVGKHTALRFGWKLGDHIPVQTGVPKIDGSTTWEFDVVAIWEFDPALMKGLDTDQFFINYEYLDEARVFDKGSVPIYFVRIADPKSTDAVIAAIDAQFLNSSAETRTVTENQYYLDQAQQLGDIGLIVNSILSAVFFALALVTGNTMMQAFRERTAELAVLKTLGFSDARVAGLVAAESLLLVVGAGAVGLGLAFVLVPVTTQALLPGASGFGLAPATLATGLALAVLLGLAAALIPAWRARRLTVVAALARV